jgi:hypothetical protein
MTTAVKELNAVMKEQSTRFEQLFAAHEAKREEEAAAFRAQLELLGQMIQDQAKETIGVDGSDPGNAIIRGCKRIEQKENDHMKEDKIKYEHEFFHCTEKHESRQDIPEKAKETSGVDGLDPGNVSIKVGNRKGKNENDQTKENKKKYENDFFCCMKKHESRQAIPEKAKETSGVDGLDPGNASPLLFTNLRHRINELNIVYKKAVGRRTTIHWG